MIILDQLALFHTALQSRTVEEKCLAFTSLYAYRQGKHIDYFSWKISLAYIYFTFHRRLMHYQFTKPVQCDLCRNRKPGNCSKLSIVYGI